MFATWTFQRYVLDYAYCCVACARLHAGAHGVLRGSQGQPNIPLEEEQIGHKKLAKKDMKALPNEVVVYT